MDDELIVKAGALSGLKERSALLREALIERESALRLARMGGTETALKPVPRRRST